MTSELESPTESGATPGGPPGPIRIAILRSCRMPQFERAVRYVRGRHPGAEITAVSHCGHTAALRAAGVDQIIEIPGKRFTVTRLGPLTLWRLRRQPFGELVIPQMTHYEDVSRNLHRFSRVFRTDTVTVLPGDQPATLLRGPEQPRDWSWLNPATWPQRLMNRTLPPALDAIAFLGLLAAACLAPRRRPSVLPLSGRRRVLLVISSLGLGGAQVQLAELLNRLPKDEYDVDLLALGGDGEFSRQWLKRDVEVAFVQQWPRLVPSVREIMARCREREYDIVHTWLFMANIVAVAAARLAGVPVVIASVRNLSVWKRERWYRKWWHRPADILGSHAADVVTVNANALVADHARWALMRQAPIEVIHNGLDPARFVVDRAASREQLRALCGAPADAVFVGAVGRLAPEKDHETFIRLLASVCRQRADVHGVLIGSGDLRGRLEAVAQAFGLAGRITFAGERKDARALMAGLDMLVLTSVSEGFPNVLLEAAFMGVPAAATDIAGNPDVLAFNESLFAAMDAEAGAERVLAMLADPARTSERAMAVRARANALFTTDRSVGAWLDLYRRRLDPGVAHAEPAPQVIGAQVH